MPSSDPIPPVPRRRSWKRRLLIGLVLLTVLFLIAPFFLGPLLRGWTVSAIEKELDVQANVRSVSFSWPARLRIQGLELLDPAGEPLLSVDELEATVELPALLGGNVHAQLDVLVPELHARRDAEGRWNWERALEKAAGSGEEGEEASSEEPTDLPSLRAGIRLVDGMVVVHGPEGQDTRLADIAFEVAVDGLDRPAPFSLGLNVRGPDGPAGRVALTGSFTAAEGGEIDVEGFRGRLELALADLDLAGLAPALALVAPVNDLAGSVAGRAELELAPGLALQGSTSITLRELELHGPLAGAAPARVGEIRLTGAATQVQGGEGTQRLELAADEFLSLTYEGSSRLAARDAGELAGTLVLSGDLEKLAELARAWIPFQEGVSLQGRLEQKTEFTGTLQSGQPATVQVSASGGITGLAAEDASGAALPLGELATVSLDLEARADLTQGSLRIEECSLRAGPLALRAHAEVAGLSTGGQARVLAVREAAFHAEADLEELRGALSKLVRLDERSFGGRLGADGTLVGDAQALRLEARVDGQTLTLAGSTLESLHGELSAQGSVDGALDGTGALELGPLALAVAGGDALRLPGVALRLTARRESSGQGTFVAGARTSDGAVELVLRGGTAPGGEELEGTFELEAGLARMLEIAGPLASPVSRLAPGLSGEIVGRGELQATLANGTLGRVRSKLEFSVASLAARDRAGEPMDLAAWQPSLRMEAQLDAGAGTLDLRSLDVGAGSLRVLASGRASRLPLRAGAGPIEIEESLLALDADLERLGTELARLVDLGGTRLGGSPLRAELALSSKQGRVEARGKLASAALTLTRPEAPALHQRDLSADFDFSLDTGAGSLVVRTASLASRTAQLTLGGKLEDVLTPEKTSGSLRLTLSGTLERILTDLGLEAPGAGRSTTGILGGTFDLQGDQGTLRLDGASTIDDFRLELAPAEPGEAPLVIAEPKIRLACAAALELATKNVQLERLTLDSGPLRGGAQGRVLGLGAGAGTSSEVRLEGWTGDFVYVPDRLGVLLAPWLPAKLSGAKEERLTFTFDGSASQLDLAGLLAGSTGRVDLGLGHFVRPEIELDGALALQAEGGRTLVHADLAANGGTLELDADMDLSGRSGQAPGSRFTLQAKDVRANSGLAPLLGLVHPAFAAAELAQGSVDGWIELTLDLSYDGPLSLAGMQGGWASLPKEPINGSGRFELRSAALRGSPLLGMLAQYGVDAGRTLDVRPIDFTITKGRVSYAKPWTWTLSGTETTFTGSVGLDQSLDLAWNLPITEKLIERWDFLAALKGENLSIPLRGTARKPRLEADDLLKDLAAKAAKRELGSRLGLGGGGSADDPAKLLEQADSLWDEGEKTEAAAIYLRLREDFKLSLTYALNKDRIKDRSKYEEAPK